MLLTSLSTVLILSSCVSALPQDTSPNERKRWASEKKTMEWKSCPELNEEVFNEMGVRGAPFDCATLAVPLDYTDCHSPKLSISLFRINATEEPALGTVLFNPGGPGGTGAENLPYDGPKLQKNMGGRYHLVSFDPRGTGRTIPFNCTPEDASALRRRGENYDLVSTNLTDRFFDGGWDDAVARADICYATNNITGQFLGTTSVARDMLEIVDALGEDGLLRYYGWSYGSALGEYFAALFPERVERMLLDGVLDPNIWKLGHRGNYLVDADAAMQGFVKECVKNKNDCAIVNSTGATSSSEVFEWINTFLEPLAANATKSEDSWELYYVVKQYIFSQLYWPANWPALAETLVLLAESNLSAVVESTSATSPTYNHGPDAVDGIRCSDAIFQVSSAEEYLPLVEYQATISKSFSDVGYEALWTCASWKMPSKGRYEGNFITKTKTPILMINGEYDVTTPIEGAYNASKLFEGSAVLPHSGYGHGILASPSECVAGYISAYFVNGTLPEPGTHCKPDMGPWELAKAEGIA